GYRGSHYTITPICFKESLLKDMELKGSHYTITPICVKVAKDVSISDLKSIFFKIKNILEKDI
ncbi:hypothetical protein ACV3UL_08490, partial [Clostridium perfringens]